ncbi:C-signal [Halyomorpha halys]|uniref:C-signal n=1 Tax=Halyomorpha halys TaxID=286706 RepID=UPI0006D4F3A8|nr:uncharacterized protein LOC106689125 [Halyomorpha halys]
MKSVLITGTNRGIGLGLVKSLLASKNVPQRIIATCRKPAEAKELQEISEKNSNVHIVQFDLNDFQSYPSLSENVKHLVGDDGLNVLINNAGIAGKFLKIGYLKADAMLECFKINTVAPTILTKEFIPLLKQAANKNSNEPLGAKRAAVINITSILGSIASNDAGGYYPYRCSKSALNAATKSLCLDLKDYKILVACIHPGWVKTDMGGAKAPLEVSSSCESLVKTISNLSQDHNGAFLNYDGEPLPW